MDKPVILIGYGGHGYVAADIFYQSGKIIAGYCDTTQKALNPFNLQFCDDEITFFSNKDNCDSYSAFVSVGNAGVREKAFDFLRSKGVTINNAIHPSANIASKVSIEKGVFIAANATINSLSTIGNGVICNTSSPIDHECSIGDFSHICPGSVLCGNVTVGRNSFIGAGSIIIPGVTVGDNVIVGAGSTVISDLVEPGVYIGSPARLIRQ